MTSIGGSNFNWYAGLGEGRDPYGVPKQYNVAQVTIDTLLRGMYANGQRRLGFYIFHSNTDFGSGTLMASAGGVVSSQNQANIRNLLTTCKSIGFQEVMIGFAPQGPNNPTVWSSYDSAMFTENWGVIASLYPIIASVGIPFKVDLWPEGVPLSTDNPAILQYSTTLWQTFYAAFGSTNAVGFSLPGFDSADTVNRIGQLISIYSGANPPVLKIHLYGKPTDVYVGGLFADVATALAGVGLGSQPWIIGETNYNDLLVAVDIGSAIAATGKTVNYLLQWPLDRVTNQNFLTPPLDYTNYLPATPSTPIIVGTTPIPPSTTPTTATPSVPVSGTFSPSPVPASPPVSAPSVAPDPVPGVGAVPSVTVNGVPKKVIRLFPPAIQPNDTSWDFAYIGISVVYNSRLPALNIGDIVRITYPSPLPYVAIAEDAASIAAVGLVEATVEAGAIADKTTLQNIADQALALGKVTPKVVLYTTRTDGFQVGQLVHVQRTELDGIDDDCVVTAVSSREIDQLFFEHQVTLSNTTAQLAANPNKFFGDLIKNTRMTVYNIQEPITFNLAVSTPPLINPGLTTGVQPNIWNVQKNGTAAWVTLIFNSLSQLGGVTTADIVIDILKNGASIYGPNILTLPAGFQGEVKFTVFVSNPLLVKVGDVFTCNVISADPAAMDGVMTLVTLG